MKAIHQTGYGDPTRALSLVEAEKPTAGANQVLVRVVASSVNAMDWRSVYASPFFIRFLSGFRRPRDPWLGGDVAGVVKAVGPGQMDVALGDEVFGIRTGAFADYVAGQNFVRKPANLTFEQAAAVPVAGVTALQALQKHGDVKPGQRVVINGAGGGVGTFAVQIAKALGAEVTAVTSTDKLEMVRSIGANHVVDYTRDDFTKSGQQYDLIVDIGGNRSVRALRRVLAPGGGRIIMVGAGHGGFGTLGRVIGGFIRNRLGQPLSFFIANGPYQEQLTTLKELIEAGKVTPVIDRSYSLGDIAPAISYVATEKARGKVVITM